MKYNTPPAVRISVWAILLLGVSFFLYNQGIHMQQRNLLQVGDFIFSVRKIINDNNALVK